MAFSTSVLLDFTTGDFNMYRDARTIPVLSCGELEIQRQHDCWWQSLFDRPLLVVSFNIDIQFHSCSFFQAT